MTEESFAAHGLLSEIFHTICDAKMEVVGEREKRRKKGEDAAGSRANQLNEEEGVTSGRSDCGSDEQLPTRRKKLYMKLEVGRATVGVEMKKENF